MRSDRNRVSDRIAAMAIAARNRVVGLAHYPDPAAYFREESVEQVEARCLEINRDFPGYILPAEHVVPNDIEVLEEDRCERFSFASPRPSGDAANDRVRLRLYRPRGPSRAPEGSVVLFHHPVFQRNWRVWRWFVSELVRHVPVAILASPYHFERRGSWRFAGEGTLNPNPLCLFRSLRQWMWDHEAAVSVLRNHGLVVRGEIGFSLGAFQTILLASLGRVQVPIVSIAALNRYAWGLRNGILGRGLLKAMADVGIEGDRFSAMVDAVELERYAAHLRNHPLLYLRGDRDHVDPPPSLDRLEQALEPTRSVLFRARHATLVLIRKQVMGETLRFLHEQGVIEADPRRTRRVVSRAERNTG